MSLIDDFQRKFKKKSRAEPVREASLYARYQLRERLRDVERSIHTRFGRYDANPAGIDIFAEDWDNLIILDACRYDLFDERFPESGEIESRISRTSATPEWVESNFGHRTLQDVVYVTANAQYWVRRDELGCEFHAVDQILSESDDDSDASWLDAQENSIRETTARAKEAIARYPNKRLLIHYPCPHRPFIGETARKHITENPTYGYKPAGVSRDTVWQAYAESFDIVIEEALEVAAEASGKTVLSSDHGEMIGDRHTYLRFRDYGHDKGIYNEYLVTVPWFEVLDDDRREIIPEPPEDQVSYDEVAVNENLRHLGYKA